MKKVLYFILFLFIAAIIKIVAKEGTRAILKKSPELTYEDSLNIYLESFDNSASSF